jgi:fucose permease
MLNDKKPVVLTIAAFSSLGMVGIFHTILGTALPAIRVSFQIDTVQAGLLGSVSWLGFTTAVLAGGVLSDIFKRHRVLMVACFLIGLSAIFFGLWRNFGANCFFLGTIGAGTGIIVSSSSALIIELYPRKEGMIMNLHHFFYAIGAIAGPLAMGYTLNREWMWQWIYRTGGIATLILASLFASLKIESEKSSATLHYSTFFLLLKERKLIILILVSMLGIGTQNGVFYWLVSFLENVRLFSIFLAGLSLSLFSIGMATGRLLSGWINRKIGNTRILLILLILLNAALFLFNNTTGKEISLALCFMMGIACSGIFPGLLALGGINFPQYSGTTMGTIATATGIGSAFMPWAMSVVSGSTSLRAGFLLCNVIALAAFCLFILHFKQLLNSEQNRDAGLT